MHGPFRIRGVALGCFVLIGRLRDQGDARRGGWGRDLGRAGPPWGDWSAILASGLHSAALLLA